MSPELCAFFNTPVGECDPEMLQAGLSEQIANVMGGRLGMDADALFATFCSRLGVTPSEAPPDAPPAAEEPAAAPTTPADAATDSPSPPPSPPLQAQANHPADDIAVAATAATGTSPGAVAATGSVFPRDPALFEARRLFHPRRRPLLERHQQHLRRNPARRAQHRPPPRRLFYAACAGPP